ncbi:hypothetical protein Q5752_006334 [Cryptotrichosporon argae]
MVATGHKFTIAVTGALGRIGAAVCELALAEGHTVLGLDRAPESTRVHPNYTYRQVDLTDYAKFKAAVAEAKCDAIVHMAAVYSQRAPTDPEGPFVIFYPEHDIHNINAAASWNSLEVAAELGINRVVMASSVNSIGMVFSKRPRFDYVPLDEKHPFYPEDAYSVCKQVVEIQSDAFVRRYPTMRVASLRFHWVITDELAASPEELSAAGGTWKDLWGWVSTTQTARSCLLGLEAPTSTFPAGTHETFFIVAPTAVRQGSSLELLKEHFPEITDIRREYKGNEGFFDCSKAERMLGWTEKAHPWTPK